MVGSGCTESDSESDSESDPAAVVKSVSSRNFLILLQCFFHIAAIPVILDEFSRFFIFSFDLYI